ncbi:MULTISPECIES: nuclear transport factor 2 family protein [unclassified Treponema]|uniref:nuclear transport factor 2 family protein n=1 Tax=unclassified Treponema TaxID=2638727 RepID=UPI0020A418ED|nr:MULTISPECIES: nuclear transport factor 2 family protein [unclassified Treponema]UTC66972.1 nuclear transport factor 2 family protein [Treponema sp. OMZ 789]UTC69701.1 nuclear transport factor 2 family protein [Treponema sp. OMZ 790]UTC72415.1 nuclear transport factor 2 family protein [Treponema sp. OMZ 791]
MNNKEVLAAFFKAENERNWNIYQRFLHSEISWQLFGKEEKKIIGVENYMQVIKKAYSNTDAQFSCVNMQISSDGNRIVTYLVNNFGARSLDIFDFKDGMIYREYEFILD